MNLEETRIYLQNLFNRPFVTNIIDLYNLELKIAVIFSDINEEYAREWADIYNMKLIIASNQAELKKSLEYFQPIVMKHKEEKLKILLNGVENASVLNDFDVQDYYDNWFVRRIGEKVGNSVFDRIKTISHFQQNKKDDIMKELEKFLFTNLQMILADGNSNKNYLQKAFAEFYYLIDDYELYSPIHLEFYDLNSLVFSCWMNENDQFVVQDVRLSNRLFMVLDLSVLLLSLEKFDIIRYRIVETGYMGRDMNACLSWVLENIHLPKELYSVVPDNT